MILGLKTWQIWGHQRKFNMKKISNNSKEVYYKIMDEVVFSSSSGLSVRLIINGISYCSSMGDDFFKTPIPFLRNPDRFAFFKLHWYGEKMLIGDRLPDWLISKAIEENTLSAYISGHGRNPNYFKKII
jgi:hypothetical protein